MKPEILKEEKLEGVAKETYTQGDLDLYQAWVKTNDRNLETNMGRKTLAEVFKKTETIVIAGIKLPASPIFDKDSNVEQIKAQIKENVEALRVAGINAVVLDTTFDRPHPLVYRDLNSLEYYSELASFTKSLQKDIKVGINMLLFDLPASLAVAKVAGIDFVFTDIFADPVFAPADESHRKDDSVFYPRPELIPEYRKNIRSENILLFAGIESKFFPKIGNRSFLDSAEIAKSCGVDVFLVADYKNIEIKELKEVGIPIFVMGGVKENDIQNIVESGFDGFSAGSMFEKEPGKIDAIKTAELTKKYNL